MPKSSKQTSSCRSGWADKVTAFTRSFYPLRSYTYLNIVVKPKKKKTKAIGWMQNCFFIGHDGGDNLHSVKCSNTDIDITFTRSPSSC